MTATYFEKCGVVSRPINRNVVLPRPRFGPTATLLGTDELFAIIRREYTRLWLTVRVCQLYALDKRMA